MTRSRSISIVIPSFNQAEYIGKTIDSILDQDYPDLEIIVMDGGSTDGTLSLLKTYGARVKWVSAADKGQSDAINKGLRLARGEIVGYINSDDFLLPGSLETINKLLPQGVPGWVTGDALIVDELGDEIQKAVRVYKKVLRHMFCRSSLLITNYLVQPSTFWTRQLLKKVGLFDETLHYSMDYDYWLRSLNISNPIISRAVLSAFRIHSKSKGGSQYKAQIAEELEMIHRHTSNSFLITLHILHSKLVTLAYDYLKKENRIRQN